MLEEQEGDYIHKADLIRDYIHLILHEALKLKPSQNYHRQSSAALRITKVFLESMERQFPVDSVGSPLQIKTAQDFANQLAVHVNHLNRSVKEVTGKSTKTHIMERVVMEAKALLHHTDWTTAEIAYAFGFEYLSYFNNFFKKLTGTTPLAFRAQLV